ncbi:MAG TPA: transposase [Chloroflexota bacterium]
MPPRSRRSDRTPRQVRFLLLRPVADLNESDQVYRAALLGICPVVQTAQRLVAEFQRVVKTHDIGALAAWLTAAQTSDVPELQGFALGIRQDRAAVEAGITEPWSQGQTEGQVNRLKAIKRTMYGRANFDLLRLRVLHPT